MSLSVLSGPISIAVGALGLLQPGDRIVTDGVDQKYAREAGFPAALPG
jgi:hypothetical protein